MLRQTFDPASLACEYQSQLSEGNIMKITLVANPPDAPCCIKLAADDGQSDLIQTDWDWPGVASSFGWSMREVQRDYRLLCNPPPSPVCEHPGTDGTVQCDECGVQPGQFIQAAREWIDAHDGATADDPGYFAETATKD
jgi:hypothetical protein